jgi:hypothetical protein
MEIKSVTDYLGYVQSFDQEHIAQWFFRGVRHADYKLVPSLFRLHIEKSMTSWEGLEAYLLKIFKRESRPYLSTMPQDEIELLTLAQHHGLPTRLLDWSTNPLIALFFALERFDKNVDSAVWCYGYLSNYSCDSESTRIARRRILERVENIIFPNHLSPRITNQSGCFTIHDLPDGKEEFIPFDKQQEKFGIFDKILIKKNFQKDIMNHLYDLGYHHGLIYPGLDGLSKKLKYDVSTTHKRFTNKVQLNRNKGNN